MRNIEFLSHWLSALKKLEQRIDAWNETQRKWLLVGMMLVVTLFSVGVCFIPAHNHRSALMMQRDQLLTATQALQAAIKHNQEEENNAKAKLKKVQKKLPATQAIAGLFKSLIKKDSGLQLLQLTTSPPVKLKEGDQDFLVDGKAVYRTGLILAISGSFENTFNYLQQLEHMPWYFFWKSMSYQVTKYPDATVTLTLEVLSIATEKAP